MRLVFQTARITRSIGRAYWGSPVQATLTLEALLEDETLVERGENRILLCDGLVAFHNSDLRTESLQTQEAVDNEMQHAPFKVRVPFHTKFALWKTILEANGREFAEGFVWARFIDNPKNTFWQKIVAQYVNFFVKHDALVSTGHQLIDRSLSLICTYIDALPEERKKEAWSILAQQAWTMERLPEGWVEIEERLDTFLYVCKDSGSVVLDGCVKVPVLNKVGAYHTRCYPPNERNRIALFFLLTKAREVKESVQQLPEDAPIEAVRIAQQIPWARLDLPSCLRALAVAMKLMWNAQQMEDAEQELRWVQNGVKKSGQSTLLS